MKVSEPRALLDGSEFVWGVGIESSTLPHLDVDQFEWTQHNRFWREDLQREHYGFQSHAAGYFKLHFWQRRFHVTERWNDGLAGS